MKTPLKFDNIRVNKKELHKSKKLIGLDLVNVNQIVTSDKFKHSDDALKYFIDYKEGEIVKLLCIIYPQVSGYIKYFEIGGKNMSFMIKNDDVLDKNNEIWDKIKEKLNIKFHCIPAYDEKYIKAKVREFDGVIKTMRMEKKNYPQLYLEECKYKMEKEKMTKFIEAKLKSDSGSELESDDELEAKLKSDSDSDSE